MTTLQNFCKMLNNALHDNLIDADEAKNLMISKMPLTLHRGEWSYPERGGCMVLNKRLVCWYSDDGEPLELHDLYIMLEGN